MIFGMRLTFCHIVSSRFILDHSLHCDNSSRQVQKPTRNQQIPLVDEREALLWSGGFCVWFCVCDALARKMRKKPCCESLKRERTVLCYVVVLVVMSYILFRSISDSWLWQSAQLVCFTLRYHLFAGKKDERWSSSDRTQGKTTMYLSVNCLLANGAFMALHLCMICIDLPPASEAFGSAKQRECVQPCISDVSHAGHWRSINWLDGCGLCMMWAMTSF